MALQDVMFHFPYVKSLEVIAPTLTTEKSTELKISNFSCTHQRSEVSGQTATPN